MPGRVTGTALRETQAERRGRAVGVAARVRPFRTPVRGHAFAPCPPAAVSPEPGRPVSLRREPANPADPLAIAVYVEADGAEDGGWRIGYLDRGVSARLAPRLDAGARFRGVLEGWVSEPDGRWQRPLLSVAPVGDDRDERQAGLWGRPPGVRRRAVP